MAIGRVAQMAMKRRADIGKKDLAPVTGASSAVTRIAVPNKPRTPAGSQLSDDAKNIKIRQRYEDIPEAGMSRPGLSKKRKSQSAY